MKVFNNRLLLVVFHLLLGFLVTTPILSKLYFLSILVYAIIDIYKTKNSNNEAFMWASYYVSAEVLMRMTGGTISWEFIKYVMILLLGYGYMIEENKKGIPAYFLLYLLLLSIGMAFSQIPAEESFRKAWIFNLSGPFTLGVSAIYFYKRSVKFTRFKEILFYSMLPMLSMLTLLYFRTPSLKEITFGTSANFETSGGFGPNQVSTALGYGMFLITILILLKERITGYKFIDFLLLFYLIFRGLLTFSRGGIITGAFGIILVMILNSIAKGNFLRSMSIYILIFGIFSSTLWIYSSNLTNGVLTNRYLGQNVKGEQKEDISSGRVDIFKAQLGTFYESPFWGIGVGSGKYKRMEVHDGVTAASHNEVSRLIEEHGLIGVIILLLLLTVPIIHMYGQPMYSKGLLLAFYAFWFLTINHSAMRIAFPGFIYGLSLINITNEEDTVLG